MRKVFLLSLFLLFGIHNIYAQLTVSFSSNPPSSLGTIQTCLGSTITYTSTSANVPVGATISWDFPGGNPASANSIGRHSVIYNSAGTYTATLTIDGVSSTVDVNVVNGLSSPNLEIENFLTFFGYIQDTLNTSDIVMAYYQTPAQPYNSLIQFDFTFPAYPADHTIIVNWGDGSSNTYAGNIGAIGHIYDCTTTNLYTANVTVISPAGCVASQNYPIYSGVPPQMSVTGNSSNHCNPEPYGFTINSNDVPGTSFEVLFSEPGAVPTTFTGPFPLNFEYIFGDHSCGQTAIISGPGGAPISYPNSFAASLLAENFCGSSFLSIGPIYVGEPPLSLMEVNPDDKSSKSLSVSDQAKLNAYIDPAVERFKALPEETNEVLGTETNQDDFKNSLQTFCRTYSFLTQIMPFSDVDLEKMFTYGRFLLKKLPRTSQNDKFKLGDEVSLEYYRLQKIAEHNIVMESQGVYELEGGGQAGIRLTKEEEANLSEIIEVLNKKFQTEFNTADKLFFDQIEEELVVHGGLKEQAQNNSIDNFKFGFEELFLDKLIARMEQNQDIFTKMMDEKEFSDAVKGYMLKKVYQRLNA